MSTIERVWDYIRNREWVVVVGFVTAIVTEIAAVLEIVAGDLNAAGEDFTWNGVIIVVASLIARSGVWSNLSVSSRENVDDVV